MLKFMLLCDFAGAVAPDSFSGIVTTSFIGRKFDFLSDFCLFRGCYLLCLNFNFMGLGSCFYRNK